jgi:hypothetical protein
VGPRTGLDTEAIGKILCPCRGSNPNRPVVRFFYKFRYEIQEQNVPVYTGICRFRALALLELPTNGFIDSHNVNRSVFYGAD